MSEPFKEMAGLDAYQDFKSRTARRFPFAHLFNDGIVGVHDFAAMIAKSGSMYLPLRAQDYFARVFIEYGALTWPNGFDIAPEWLRREMAATSHRSE